MVNLAGRTRDTMLRAHDYLLLGFIEVDGADPEEAINLSVSLEAHTEISSAQTCITCCPLSTSKMRMVPSLPPEMNDFSSAHVKESQGG